LPLFIQSHPMILLPLIIVSSTASLLIMCTKARTPSISTPKQTKPSNENQSPRINSKDPNLIATPPEQIDSSTTIEKVPKSNEASPNRGRLSTNPSEPSGKGQTNLDKKDQDAENNTNGETVTMLATINRSHDQHYDRRPRFIARQRTDNQDEGTKLGLPICIREERGQTTDFEQGIYRKAFDSFPHQKGKGKREG
ncbi:hypothetical protein PENTCL1PPCAC_22597, partial [Pristionchus entomophagus]